MNRSICQIPTCINHGKYCRLHLQFSVKEVSAIAKESEERKRINRKEYAPKAKQFIKDHPICAAKIKGVCSGKSKMVHHKIGKNSTEDLLNENFWLEVCFPCHRVIEENPAFAKQNNFSLSRHSKV